MEEESGLGRRTVSETILEGVTPGFSGGKRVTCSNRAAKSLEEERNRFKEWEEKVSLVWDAFIWSCLPDTELKVFSSQNLGPTPRERARTLGVGWDTEVVKGQWSHRSGLGWQQQSRKRRGLRIRFMNLQTQGKTFKKKLPGNPALEPDFWAHCIFLPAWLSSLRSGHPLSASSRLLGLADSKEVASWREAAPGLGVAEGSLASQHGLYFLFGPEIPVKPQRSRENCLFQSSGNVCTLLIKKTKLKSAWKRRYSGSYIRCH